MTGKCSICNKEEAVYKVRDNKSKKEFLICEWHEDLDCEIIEELKSTEKKSVPNVTYGRLHLVKKTRVESFCRDCDSPILVGQSCYNQKKQIEGMAFPLSTKLCLNCSDKLIKQGTKVAE